ncbi:TlpA family protein disulfide reductase [bacterium]|nr:TlpA family protein disulfide reductase [bacterium]
MKKILLLIALGLSLYAGISKGDKAVDFDLKSLDQSKSFKQTDFKGEVVLLNLWASWCSGCKEEMPEFFKLQKEYKSGFKIVAVSIDKNADDSQKFLKSLEDEMGYETPFVTIHDGKKMLPKAYGAVAMPSSYLIDKNGVVRLVIVGSLSNKDIQELKQEIDKLK